MIKLLIVEDDKSQIQAFKDTISEFNRKAAGVFDNPDYRSDLESSINDLERKTAYDAAIIDLKLKSGSGADVFEGKELIAKIYNKIRIPIVVYSGNVSQVEEEETALFLKRPRDKHSIAQILVEIKKIFDTGITEILSSEGTLENNLSQIFWSHFAPNLKYWINKPDKKSLTRYIVSHIYDKLEISDSGDFENYNQAEVYILPPIRSNLHTGDIFKYNGDAMYLVITPACDIELKTEPSGVKKRKASKITVLKLNEFDAKVYCLNKAGSAVEKNKVMDIISNKLYRYQFLPPYLNEKGYILDFEDVLNIDFTVESKLTRIASLSQVFLKDIISRFASYYGRLGQPIIADSDKLVNDLSAS